ncbi:SLBB domain-containing protein [candidate division KSB1 bacterium]
MKIIRRTFVLLFIFVLFNIAFSQEDIESFKRQLKSMGMTDTQINNLIRNYGFTAPRQQQLPLQFSRGQAEADSIMLARQREILYGRSYAGSDTTGIDSLRVERLYPFGYSVFRYSPSYAEPFFDYGIISYEYPVGPGDEIILTIWGDVESYKSYTVDREGSIYIVGLGKIYVANKTYRELKEYLLNLLKKIHPRIDEGKTIVEITLGKLRRVKVFVTGEVFRPSDYYVNTLSDVVNLIYKSGGIINGGSLRNVELKRNGKVEKIIDLYEFILKGNLQTTERLQDHDVVFVPFAQKTVAVKGEIKRPAVYEIKDDETIEDLINFAGGFTSKTYFNKFNIDRIVPFKDRIKGENEREILSFYDLNEFYSQVPMDGDTVTLFKIDEEKDNYVTVTGRIKKDGEFGYYAGLTLDELINKAGGLEEDAYLEKMFVIRTNPDSTFSVIAMSYDDIKNPEKKVELAPWDHVIISSIWDFEEKPYVEIYGEVRAPGIYPLMENLTLNDLIHLAGGLKETAFKIEAQVSRMIPESLRVDRRTNSELFKIPILSKMGSKEKDTFYLKKYDNVFIRENPEFTYPKKVYIFGEVQYPGPYPLLKKNEKITDLMLRSGGFTERAYLDGITFFRKSNDIGRISIDFQNIMNKPDHVDNLFLVEEDSIYVPERINTVRVMGTVGFPVSVLHEKGKGVSYYIKSAGGFTEESDKGKVQIIYPNGQVTAPRRFWRDPEIKPGSTILVPKKIPTEGINWTEVVRNWVQIISSLATTIFILKNIK